jgi:hypothetical protein
MGASRLQQAADILGVTVPFFFEGSDSKPYRSSGDEPSPAYIDDFVHFGWPASHEIVHATAAHLAAPYCRSGE